MKDNFEAKYFQNATVNMLYNERGYSQGVPEVNCKNHCQNLLVNNKLLYSKNKKVELFYRKTNTFFKMRQ